MGLHPYNNILDAFINVIEGVCVFTHYHFVEDWAIILNLLISFWWQEGKIEKLQTR